jgi:hypothetical protein
VHLRVHELRALSEGMVLMRLRRPEAATVFSLLVAAGCGSGALAPTAAVTPEAGGAQHQDGSVTADGASGQDGATAQDGASGYESSAQDAVAEATPDAVGLDATSDAVSAGGCSVTSSSSLPGVSIVFRTPVTCSFTLAQARAGIMIPYDVVVASDVTGVVPAPQDAGGCGSPGASGLIVFEQLAGGGQSYCLCDTGLCAPGSPSPVTLRAGSYAGVFSWTGHNWGGPSDTGNPMGAAFPAGSYSLTVSARGTQSGASFAVAATLTIVLTP